MTLIQTALKEIHYWWPKLSNDTQWPCPDGFHVPLTEEWASLCSILTSTFGFASNRSTMNTYLKMPSAWLRHAYDAKVYSQSSEWHYWSSSALNINYSYSLMFYSSWLRPQYYTDQYPAYAYSIRPFKDTPVIPNSSRSTLYQWSWSAWIFHNATLWLISVSWDWTNWTTISDKNVWATTVYNSWDALSETNCGKHYQRWNNYGFPFTWSVTSSSTKVDASSYWPWNYYSSSTFIIVTRSPYNWSSVQNDNLRWWVSKWTQDKSKVKAVYLWTNKVRPSWLT